MEPTNTLQQTVILAQPKSMGIALILTFLFGPLGLLYASVPGGIIMIIVGVLGGIVTLGIGAIVAWVLSFIWAIIAVSRHNSKINRMANS